MTIESNPTPRHVARRPLGASLMKSLLTAAVALFVATGIALFGAGGTYALLSSSAPTTPTTAITAANAAMTVSTPAAFAYLAPGRSISQTFTISNTGDIPLAVGVGSSTFSGGLAGVANVQITDSPTCAGGNVLWNRTSSNTVTTATWPALPAGYTATLCMTVTIDSNAAASTEGTNLGMNFVLSGRQ